ncbi:MAG: M48 family metalloprotease, partial [Candidatus Omnitrophota bacterium]
MSGCALTGPYVSEEEIRQAGTELKVKALKFQIDYLVKVNNIGYKLLLKLPEEDKKKDFVYSGLLLSKIDEYFVKLYHLSSSNGVVVTGVVEDSPAKGAGVIAGDVIKSIENLPINDLSDAAYVLNHKAPGQLVELEVLRSTTKINLGFRLGSKPLDVSFRMVDEQEVNAGAIPNLIVVTYGLMRFTKSDDEVAAVLGHELAHITKGHHLKGSGIDFISMLAGLAAGIGANKVSPGSGDAVMRSVSAAFSSRFSQDFEREADYFGLKYVYLAGFNIEAGVDVWERFAIEIP